MLGYSKSEIKALTQEQGPCGWPWELLTLGAIEALSKSRTSRAAMKGILPCGLTMLCARFPTFPVTCSAFASETGEWGIRVALKPYRAQQLPYVTRLRPSERNGRASSWGYFDPVRGYWRLVYFQHRKRVHSCR